ncbi:MAG: sigma-54 dependent transcriptional regulator [Pseudomonadota bacterium]
MSTSAVAYQRIEEPAGQAFANTCNAEMLRLFEHARVVAHADFPVLIEGETGTGKELLARAIHRESGRNGPFVAVNVSAIPESLFETELFGAKRGAYTGLVCERRGFFREAHGGTLFLDEIGDMPASQQAKLLRVLEDGEVRPLGSSATVRVDVRVIAATHRNLSELIREKLFRRDLYFRMRVAACLRLLPLRQRHEDIPLLLQEELERAIAGSKTTGQKALRLHPDVIALAMRYSWPGNVSELAHMVAEAVRCAHGSELGIDDFALLRERVAANQGTRRLTDSPYFRALAEFERRYFQELLARTGFNISHAAEVAGLSRSAIRTRARTHGLLGPDPLPRGRPRQGA